MASMTNYLENELLDHALGKDAFPMPTVHLALFTSDPTEAGSLAGEVVGGGYARQAMTASMSAASGGASSNGGSLTFGPATADWGTVTHIGIMDASTAGNMLFYAPLAASKTVFSGDSIQFTAGQLSVTFQ